MENLQMRLDTLRADAIESYLIGGRATDPRERELFTRMADYLTILAETVECVVSERKARRDA